MKDKKASIVQPLVSIVILTYNHEKYIAQAIEGVLAQKVSFDYEIILSNDCSTDGTDAVCRKYAETNLSIRYFNHELNMGLIANHCWSVKQAKGKYIAYCDGDDYWIDEYKLQRQMDYMEAHPECSLCYHNVILEFGNNRSLFLPVAKRSGAIELAEIVGRWAIPTSAVVYRRELIIGKEDEVINYPNEDYAVEIYMRSKGEYYYDATSIGAVYRRHAASVTAGMNANEIKMYEDIIRLLADAKIWFPNDEDILFDSAIKSYQERVARIERNIKNPFLKYLKKNTYKKWLLSILN
ncbi:MAG: glycosyltransferase [Paludibacteraceae bacterium]|nr:glycosyltransferase [Paludibacteraceae bacterium]